jgi:choline-sulfatase
MGYETGNPPTGIRHRLYDLLNDPEETTDVSDNPENQKILMEFKMKMLEVFNNTHPKAADLPPDLSIDARLQWFCEPPEGNIPPDMR